VGAIADNLGRKKMCVVYSLFYAISCLVKLSTSYYVLMVSATSQLFTVLLSHSVKRKHGQLTASWKTLCLPSVHDMLSTYRHFSRCP
jgi:hypothetical protein